MLRNIRVWSFFFFFSSGLYVSALSTYYFEKIIFHLSVSDMFSVCSEF